MANYTYTDHVGDGTTITFPFTFVGAGVGYLKRDHVFVFVNDSEALFSFSGSNQVTITPAPSDGDKVRIRRIMPKDRPFADFSRGNVFSQDLLNNSFLQSLYIYHEFLDGFLDEFPWKLQGDVEVMGLLTTSLLIMKGDIDMEGNRLLGLPEPGLPDEAATKSFADGIVESATEEAERAEEEANKAANSATSAAESAAIAQQYPEGMLAAALSSDEGSKIVTFKRSATAAAVAKSIEEYLTTISIDASQFGSPDENGVWNADVIQKSINVVELMTSGTQQVRYSGAEVKIPNGRFAADIPLIIRRRGLILSGSGRGTIVYPSGVFTGDALIQSRATEDRNNSLSINVVVRQLSLYGKNPVDGDFNTTSDVIGALLSSWNGEFGPCGFHDVFFWGLKECIRGQRLYGMSLRGCSFKGTNSGSGAGIALNYYSDLIDNIVDTGGVRAHDISACNFMDLHHVILADAGYGYSISNNCRIERIRPSASNLGVQYRAAFMLRDARGWDISGNYIEATNGDLFRLGVDNSSVYKSQGVMIKGNYIQESNTTGATLDVRGATGCEFTGNHIRETAGRVDVNFISGALAEGNKFDYFNTIVGATDAIRGRNTLSVYQKPQPAASVTSYNNEDIINQTGPATKSVTVSFDSSATGIRSSVYNSVTSRNEGNNSAVLSSLRVLNQETNVISMGSGSGTTPSLANRNIRLTATGNITYTGTLTTSFADFGEYVENGSSYPLPLGCLVTLIDGKAALANEGDDVVGVVSKTAGIMLNDSPFAWYNRYLTGDFGEPLYETVLDMDYELEEGETEDDRPLVTRRIENPEFDIEQENIPRSERPNEWTPVGMIGQMYIRVSDDVQPDDYIKAGTAGVGVKSESATRIKVMSIKHPFDSSKGYSVAYCLRS